jgi:hypothetical protein
VSKDETTSPTQRSLIDVDRSPAPPWTGLKFECYNSRCRAVYQLEAGDKCIPTDREHLYMAPACFDCGVSTVIDCHPRFAPGPEKKS